MQSAGTRDCLSKFKNVSKDTFRYLSIRPVANSNHLERNDSASPLLSAKAAVGQYGLGQADPQVYKEYQSPAGFRVT